MSASGSNTGRKHTTHACDECKRRKSKCDGQQPCARCTVDGSDCLYRSVDGRAQRRPIDRSLRRKSRQSTNLTPGNLRNQRRSQQAVDPESQSPHHRYSEQPQFPPQSDIISCATEAEPIEPDLGDGTTHSFLKRVCNHLTLLGKAHPREVTREKENADSSSTALLLLPERQQAIEYIDCFFDHMNATYRYLARSKIEQLVEDVYGSDAAMLENDAAMALFLSVISCGCVWMASWKRHDLVACRHRASQMLQTAQKKLRKADEKLPPSMTVLQAHFAYGQALMACHKFDSAWLALGQTIRLSQIVGLGKARRGVSPLEDFERRGLFWSIFMADRYLAMFLGRPFGISDHDISIPLPEDPPASIPSQLDVQEQSLIPGTVAHIRILKITGRIVTSLYGLKTLSQGEKSQLVSVLESQIETWLQQTPSFFHSDQLSTKNDFYSVSWLFKRQQKTIRSAYYLTKMLLYREFLLQDFTNRIPGTPSSLGPQLSVYSQKCRDAAISMAKLAAEFALDDTYVPTFWGTSHSIFCAISILVVSFLLFDDRHHLEPIIEGAMKAHMALTGFSSAQQQRLLEESQSMVKSVLHEATGQAAAEGEAADDTAAAELLDSLLNNRPAALDNCAGHDMGIPMVSHIAGSPGAMELQDMSANGLPDAPTSFGADMLQAGGLESGLQMMMDIGFDKETFGDDFGSFF